jgi:hypothetical protein
MKSNFFRQLSIVIILLASHKIMFGQLPAVGHVTRQCSLIREIVTAGREQHFAPIQQNEIGSTLGYKTDGSWEFKTTRYDAALRWPGANRNYLESYSDKTDTGISTTYQYIAEYTHVPNVISAKDIYTYLNRQIEGCQFPLEDGKLIDFEPLPDSMLPPDKPAILETASLYNLPILGLDKNSTIHVMVGMEKRLYDYNVCLIVENVDKKQMGKLLKK